jgi:hypothetical protein
MTKGEGVFAISATTTKSVTSPEFELTVVEVARASSDLPFLPRQLCRDLVKLVPSLVGTMGARHRWSVVVPWPPTTVLAADVARVRYRGPFSTPIDAACRGEHASALGLTGVLTGDK